jgi:hypothetical protein
MESARRYAERAAIVNRAAEIMREHTDEFSDLITLEMGEIYQEAVGETQLSADILSRCMSFAPRRRQVSRGPVSSLWDSACPPSTWLLLRPPFRSPGSHHGGRQFTHADGADGWRGRALLPRTISLHPGILVPECPTPLRRSVVSSVAVLLRDLPEQLQKGRIHRQQAALEPTGQFPRVSPAKSLDCMTDVRKKFFRNLSPGISTFRYSLISRSPPSPPGACVRKGKAGQPAKTARANRGVLDLAAA